MDVQAAGYVEAVPLKYDDVLNFSEGMAAVQLGGKWGFIALDDQVSGLDDSSRYPTSDVTDEGDIRVAIDGKSFAFDVQPRIGNDRILVPLRTIFGAMGADVTYDDATQTVTATKGETVIVLIIGDMSPTVNGQIVPLDQPGFIADGRTMAPLRFVAEAFGGTAIWDGLTQIAVITRNTIEYEKNKIHTGELRIATTGIGSVGCEYGVIAGDMTDYLKMIKLSEDLSELSLPRSQESEFFKTACFEFSKERPKEIKLLCAMRESKPTEVDFINDIFQLPVDIGEYYYFVYFMWDDYTTETIFFRANAFIM